MRVPGFKVELRKSHMELMRIPRRFWEVTLDRVPDSVRSNVTKYISNIEKMLDEGNGIIFLGQNGTGKTCAAVVIAKAARRIGSPVLFITAEGLRQAVIDKEIFSGEQTVYDRAKSVELLVLDDLGKEHRGNSNYTEHLFENLIRVRASSRLTTITTTNIMYDELQKRYKLSMMEVMRECMYPLVVKGDNNRTVQEEKLKELIA